MIRIESIGTASPEFSMTQAQAEQVMTAKYKDELTERAFGVMQQVLAHPSIEKRHMSVENMAELESLKNEDMDIRMTRFTRWAVRLAKEALLDALQQAGRPLSDVKGIVCNTCTGYICPGISTYLVEELDLPAATRVYDLVGSGCGGAVPNIQTGRDILAGMEDDAGVVVSISVEICSAPFEMDSDMSLIISNCIFGDGAGAALLSKNSAGLELGDIETAYLPKYRDHVRFTYRNGRLHNHLHPKLAGIIGREVGPMIETALAGAGLSAEDVPHWALHPGGAKVLDELRDALDLSEEQMGWSRKILREHGNMSSPSVLFELKEIFDTKPAPGTPVMISAYGAGLSAFAVPGVFRGPAPR